MKKTFSLFLVLMISFFQSQILKDFVIPKGYEKIIETKGDLDKDGKDETVIIFNTDKKNQSGGYERKFYILKSISGNLKVWKENSSLIIDSVYGFYPADNQIDITIKNQCLIISQMYFTNSRHTDTSKYTFRFLNGDFYLIGIVSQFDDTCDFNLKNEINFSTGKVIVDEQYSSCDDEHKNLPEDNHTEFTHLFDLIKMNDFRIGEHKIKIPNSNKYLYY